MTARPTSPFPRPRIPMRAATRSSLRAAADRWAVTLLTAGALVWLSLAGGGYGPIPRHVAGTLVWLVALGLLLRGGQSALPRGPVRRIALAIAAFAALSGLSMLWSESAGRSYNELTRVLLDLGVFVVVATIAAWGPRRRDQLLEGITAGALIVIGLAVLSRLVPGPFPDQELQRL